MYLYNQIKLSDIEENAQYTSNQVNNRFPHKRSDLLRGQFRKLKFGHSTGDPKTRNHNFFAILQSLLFSLIPDHVPTENQSIALPSGTGSATDFEPFTLS